MNHTQATKNKPHRIFHGGLIVALCLIPLIGIYSPRTLAYLPAVIGLFGTLSFRLIHKEWPEWRKDILIISGLLLGCIALNSLWSINAEKAVERLIKMAPLLLGSCLLFNLLQAMPTAFTNRFRHYFSYALIVSLIMLLFELVTKGFLFKYLHDMERFGNTSSLNSSIVLAYITGLPLILSQTKKVMIGLLLGLFALCMIFTDSQSVQLALLLSLPFLWKCPISAKGFWAFLIGLTTTLMMTAPWIAQFGYKNIAALLDGKKWFAHAYASSRLEIWNAISERALEKPFFGHGIEATRIMKDLNISNAYFEHDSVLHPHNFALQVWIEFGAFGAVLSSLLIAYIFLNLKKTASKTPEVAKASLVIFIAILSMGATSYGLWQGWWLGTLLWTGALTQSFILQRAKST